jgi:hypothetical protein
LILPLRDLVVGLFYSGTPTCVPRARARALSLSVSLLSRARWQGQLLAQPVAPHDTRFLLGSKVLDHACVCMYLWGVYVPVVCVPVVCVCLSVCVYVCVYVCMFYVCVSGVCVYVYVCMYVHVCAYTIAAHDTCAHVCVRTLLYHPTHVYVYGSSTTWTSLC